MRQERVGWVCRCHYINSDFWTAIKRDEAKVVCFHFLRPAVSRAHHHVLLISSLVVAHNKHETTTTTTRSSCSSTLYLYCFIGKHNTFSSSSSTTTTLLSHWHVVLSTHLQAPKWSVIHWTNERTNGEGGKGREKSLLLLCELLL